VELHLTFRTSPFDFPEFGLMPICQTQPQGL
jgi:hypothetical protein